MTIAFVFPGQGSWDPDDLAVWAEHPSAAVVDRVARRSGLDLWDLPEEAGEQTALAQPAIFAACLAAHRALGEAGVHPQVVAGHSLGEVAAAVAAGALSLQDGIGLVVERGRAFADACASTPGVMAAVLRVDHHEVARLVEDVRGAHVANVNAPRQVVVSGSGEAIDRVRDALADRRARVVDLDVEGAFHSPAMEPARKRLEELLDGLDIQAPSIGFVSGTAGQILEDAGEVREALIGGVRSPVQWVAVQERLVALGVDHLVEVGPGTVLSGLAKRTVPDLERSSVSKPADLEALVESLAPQSLAASGATTSGHALATAGAGS